MRKLSYNMNENSPARVRCRPQKGPWFVAACRYNIWFISLPNDINLFSNSMITLAYGCYNLKLRSGILNISKTSIGVPPYQTKCKWSRTAKPSQRHKKIPKKKWGKYGKSQFFGARLHFSMVILCRQLQKDFYEVARGQHPAVIILSFDCWEPQLSKKYRVERGYPDISGSKIFKLFKSSWVPDCRAAGSIPYEFAYRQLGDTDAGMYR